MTSYEPFAYFHQIKSCNLHNLVYFFEFFDGGFNILFFSYAYAQSDQSLCLSHEYSMSVKLLTEQCLELLSLKGGCTSWSEATLVKMPHVGIHVSRLVHLHDAVCWLWPLFPMDIGKLRPKKNIELFLRPLF